MAVKIRLTRIGKVHAPYYRVVVADSRTRRDGKTIEDIGKYHPTEEPSTIDIDSERAQYWLSVGAQPTDQVRALLKLTGDWQKFTGEGEAVNTVKPQPEKAGFAAPAAGSVVNQSGTPTSGSETTAAEAPAPASEDPASQGPGTQDFAPAADSTADSATAESTEEKAEA